MIAERSSTDSKTDLHQCPAESQEMAMSLAAAAAAAAATASGGTDSGVETGNESNDIDVNISNGLHGFDSLENDVVHILVPPPPPTSPESANESQSHDESESEMSILGRDHYNEYPAEPINNFTDLNGDDCVTDMDRDIEEDELEITNALANSYEYQCRENKNLNGVEDLSNLPFAQGFTSMQAFAIPAFSPPPAPPATPTNLNTCKALMKFEFPELPKLSCQFVDPPAGFQSFMSLHQFKVEHGKGYSVVTPADEARKNECTALIPYEQRDLQKKTTARSSWNKKVGKKFRCQYMAGREEYNERRLRAAANAKNIPVLTKLLESGTDPNASDELGRTALHIAACKGFSEVVRLLLQSGANPNRKDSVGNTPLHLAACTNHFDVVTCLLRAGTDVSTLDNHGRNPLQLAQSKLKLIASSKQQPTEDAIKIKMEVQQIIEMMLEYLQKKGQDVEAELLNAFANRLTLSQTPDEVDADVKSLLANLSSLTLNAATSSASLHRYNKLSAAAIASSSNSVTSPLSRSYLQPAKFTVAGSTSGVLSARCPSMAENVPRPSEVVGSRCNDNNFNSGDTGDDPCRPPFTFFK
ncbi:unnamed protein product [Allacma fusca]|uniref:Ankyrin repeat domain-containing protein 54 n=1 Tax=Allacma fusca TaxID=39272 RepID=A0A8J2JKM8_9HEXA|nr:unnamed protein product [Allacma fusca]